MHKFDDTDLLKAQNAAWAGLKTYYDSNGTESDYMDLPDTWGSCTSLNKNQTRCTLALYQEFAEGLSAFFGG
jgi:hypothetical protein